MSRCFPYPPPGYYGSKASNEPLIESIKLQKESEKAKAERKKEKKDKKREKKEKKDRKGTIKDKLNQNLSGGQYGKAQRNGGQDLKSHGSWVDSKGLFNGKRREDVCEQMERSGLTEEHEPPVSVHKPSYSSDSTENSNKRKRPASPSPIGITGHGNVIRIRLPLRRHKEPNLGKESICSTSGRAELSAPLRKDAPLQSRCIEDNKLSCSTTGTNEVLPIPIPILSVSTPFEKELQTVSLLYKELIGSWVPPAPRSDLSSLDDEEWLFSGKHQDDRQGEKRYKPTSDLSCRGSSNLQPRAQFVQEADIFALPYTLPF